MAKQGSFSVKKSLAKLNKDLSDIPTRLTAEINDQVKSIATAAFGNIQAKAQSKLNTTRQEYLAGLKFEEVSPHSFMISLEGDWANAIEGGYGGYDMSIRMLASKALVSAGKRAGMPWVQTSKPRKDEPPHKFAHVPFPQNPNAAPTGSDMGTAIKAIRTENAAGRLQKITSIFKDAEGNAMQGEVARVKQPDKSPDLIKYQNPSQTSPGKIHSIYMRYRTVSAIGKPWMHPAYTGLKAFEDAEREIEANLDQLVKSLI